MVEFNYAFSKNGGNLMFEKFKYIQFYLDKYFSIRMDDEKYLMMYYEKVFKKKLNLSNPKTFNEKLQWLKLNNRNNEYTAMVDKYLAKKYVGSKIGNEYIIPTIGIYNNFNEIDFDALPNSFVMKCTHDSGRVIICKDKNNFNRIRAKKIINKGLKHDYYYDGREWPYKNVKKRIIIEKYMADKANDELKDYKFFCFNGQPKYVLVCSERTKKLKETFYDTNWNIAPFKRPHHDVDNTIPKPKNFKKMLELSSKLSNDIPFLRVDFYEINGNLYFGELTFFPASGMSGFEPAIWDEKLGKNLDISKVKQNEKKESNI